MAKNPIRSEDSATPPSTPTLRRSASQAELDVDPEMYTPSKRVKTLYNALASTSSGSFLVSNDKLTSSTPIIAPNLEAVPSSIPQPDWSLVIESTSDLSYQSYQQLVEENKKLRTNLQHGQTLVKAQEGIIEASHATIVVQNLHLAKLNVALHGREKPKTSGRQLIIDSGKGQVFSSDEILEGLRSQDEKKKEAAADKQQRAEARAAKKAAGARIAAEWQAIKDEHERRVGEWETTCQKHAEEGLPKKHWPKKPVRPPKPTLEDDEDEEPQDDGGGEDEDR
ncbi:hypothetical protein FA13DRAFT_1629801 [Coprinellus micaceus]|uniref:Uncharacterized protein n=1 Tax=Coprinellus micaceus TaxID=71717 RepID=A0A4Y7TAG5_COPMI|nr:hypothetical protein FA13DRAFT_1629801 [Coprinellus micaceus]